MSHICCITTMKLKKFVNKINNHQFPEGSTFHIKKNGTIEQECYIEYQRDHAGIPILYLNELNLDDGSVIWHNELPASLLIDPDIRFVRRS